MYKSKTHKITALTAIEEVLSITIHSNGYSLEVNDKDIKNDGINANYVMSTHENMIDLIAEVDQKGKA
jgi:hypothetical protein